MDQSASSAALIAHRRRMGMIPSDRMPPTRRIDDDCGCGPKVPKEYSYKPRGTKNPRYAHLKVK
jgi:hypothetical protein